MVYGNLQGASKHRSIEYLEIPGVEKEWLKQLVPSSDGEKLFPSLKQLTTSISDSALELFVPLIQHVTELRLRTHRSSLQALRIAAGVPALTGFFLETFEGCIQATDLIFLADNCPNIVNLCIANLGRHSLRNFHGVTGFSNITVDRVTARLPRLKTFTLLSWQDTLTEAALLSLALHCKRLSSIFITAKVSIAKLVLNGRPNIFPALGILVVDTSSPYDVRHENLQELARQFLTNTPRLHHFSLRGYVLKEHKEFQKIVREMLKGRPNWDAEELLHLA